LESLERILTGLRQLEPTESTQHHVTAIQALALASQLPLQDFLVQLEKYEASLGPFSDRGSFRTAGRKSQWAIVMGEKVEKLKACLTGNIVSINMLLQLHAR
jgi:hypothetical protein